MSKLDNDRVRVDVLYGHTVMNPMCSPSIYVPPLTWRDKLRSAVHAVLHFLWIMFMCLLVGIGMAIDPKGFATGFVTTTVMLRR